MKQLSFSSKPDTSYFTKRRLFLICITVSAMMTCYHFSRQKIPSWTSSNLPSQVVIDIGHGGSDPGKIGLNNALEKDINLAIGLYLKEYLSSSGITVTLTRETDISLADRNASNQKLSDFQNRTELIRNLAPSAVISIHQNSYPQEAVRGAQVFHRDSRESKHLAECIQHQCRRILDTNNNRQIKKNTDYYLFRHINCPIVIVECGFLSNYEEANLLIKEDYQRRTAWAVYMGILQYLKTLE